MSEGDEFLKIDLWVVCLLLAWNINLVDYFYFMNFVLQLDIEGVFFMDKLDIVGAFIDGQLWGYVKVEVVFELNIYMVFLMVYSNVLNG